MKDLTNINYIKKLLSEHNFRFSKSLGQNFLIDKSVLEKIIEDSGIDSEYGVIEIGPGIGTLTLELSQAAKKVVAVEIDRGLKPILEDTLSGCENVKVIFADILKTDINSLIKEEFDGGKVAVCANLPYYITTPIIMYLLEGNTNIEQITVMVQKEVAERFAAREGTSDYGAVTLAVNYYSEPKILFEIGAESFLPKPKVNSAVINFKIRKKPPVIPQNKDLMFKIIKLSFAQRRKTLANSLHNGLSYKFKKEDIISAIKACGFDENIRGEAISLNGFSKLSDILHGSAD